MNKPKGLMIALGVKDKPEDSPYPEFDYPPELKDLDSLKKGEQKEVVAIVKKNEDGKCELVSINGVDLSGQENQDEDEGDEGIDTTDEDNDEAEENEEPSISQKAQSVGLM